VGSEKRSKIKTVIVVFLVISVFLIVTSVVLIFNFVQDRPLQSVEYEVFFSVGDGNIGVDINNSELIFGRTSAGGPAVTRFVTIDNGYSFTIRVDVFVSESVADVLEINSSYVVGIEKNVTVEVRLRVPENYEDGDYTGKIRFDLYELR
jgi:hypothetical protein